MTVINVGCLKRRPVSEPVCKSACRQLVEHFEYHDPETARFFVVPPGFHWDGTSIPRALWSVLGGPFNPKYEIAGLIHDYLYRLDVHDDLPRQIADEIFYDILRLEGVSWFRAQEMYWGVRAGGWLSYNKKELNWTPNIKAAA